MMTDEELGKHIGQGWWPLAKAMLAVLDMYDFELLQLKEKFAGLRVYAKAPADATPGIKASVHAVLLAGENASYKTCEECGEAGQRVLIHNTWWKTRCERCAKCEPGCRRCEEE